MINLYDKFRDLSRLKIDIFSGTIQDYSLNSGVRDMISLAPMMGCTDRHFRYLVRLISRKTRLYTEMVTAKALVHGNAERLLAYDPVEHPIALQLGGSCPAQLATAAKIGVAQGYDEINLNVGCPSDRVQAGEFGACLFKRPELVAECVAAIASAVSVPVTIKTRIGVDDWDAYTDLVRFIEWTAAAGCKTFIIHARKAWLQGLSPKENRDIPPLQYDVVHQLKRDFAEFQIIVNGGLQTVAEIAEQLQYVDGVMLGRAAYKNPGLLALCDQALLGIVTPLRMTDVVHEYLPYVNRQLALGVRLHSLTRHMLSLFSGQLGARDWRRALSSGAEIGEALAVFDSVNPT